jgi:6,7-dimethyl-8-ribityllumazine synthase
MASTLPMPTFDKPVKLLIVAVQGLGDWVAKSQAVAKAAGVEIDLVEVPGVMEVPVAIAMAEQLAEFDGYVALATASGATMQEAWRGVSLMGLQGACIGNGIGDGLSDGRDPTEAALHLVAISRRWAAATKGIGFRA